MMIAMEATFDFPFVETLPKREKTKLATLWDRFQEIRELTEREGPLVPVRMGSELMGVSRQRVDELIERGRLRVHGMNGHRMLFCADIIEYANAERKSGRPPLPVETMNGGETIRVVCRMVKESRK